MKKVVTLAVLVALLMPALVTAGGQGEAGAARPVVMKLGHDLPDTTPQHVGAVRFKELVESRSNGTIQVQIYPAGQLGSDIEVTELMQAGAVEAGLVPTAKLSGFDPALQIVDLPFLFPSREVAYRVLDSEAGLSLMDDLREKNLIGLAFWESGFKQLTARFPITGPQAYRGTKIRVMESPILIEQFRAMGANAIPIDFAEVYNALQQGIVDGQENPLVSIVNMRFYEVQDYMALSNHGYLAYAFLVSQAFYNRLTPDQQRIIREAAIETAQYQRQVTIDREQGFIQTIRDSGTNVIEFTPEQRRAFEEATRPVHDHFANVIGRDTLNRIYAEIERQR